MRIRFHSPRLKPSGRIGSCSIFALGFALSAFSLAAHAQTVGPITPKASAQPQQAPSETPTPAPDRDSKNNLAGAWKLNRDQSDDPRQKVEQASNGGGGGWGQGPAGGGGGWGRPGGWGGWGGPGSSGGGGGWNRGGRTPDEGALDMSDFSQLTIEQSDSAAKVIGANGRVLAQYDASNGSDKKNTRDAAKKSKENPNTPPAARWQGDDLVTTTNGPRGTKTTRIYELSPNGKQLYVTTRLDNPRFNQPVNIRFVYDPARSSGN
jgi:hypothetical protein